MLDSWFLFHKGDCALAGIGACSARVATDHPDASARPTQSRLDPQTVQRQPVNSSIPLPHSSNISWYALLPYSSDDSDCVTFLRHSLTSVHTLQCQAHGMDIVHQTVYVLRYSLGMTLLYSPYNVMKA